MYYQKNLEMIKNSKGKLYDLIVNFENSDSIIVESEQSKSGILSMNITKDGRKTYMNSLYDPDFEADKFVEQYDDRVIDYSVMVMHGFGNGIVARKMVEKMPEHIVFLFIEPSIDIFVHIIHNYDISDILSNDRVGIFVNGDKTNIEALIMSFTRSDNYKYIFYDNLPKYKLLFPDEYESLKEKYEYIVDMLKVNIGTGKFFAKDVAINELYNMRYILKGNTEEDFEGKMNINLPAILVAAGPSLEKNIEELRRAKGHALIIAVDSALRYLVSKDIYPDLAIVADPRKPIVIFEDEKVQKLPLAIHTPANYKAVELMKNNKIIYASAESAYYDAIYGLIGKHMYRLSTGGSVSTVAFALAVAWGFRRLVLIGQDLALSNGKVHAGKDDIDTEKLTNDKLLVPGYYGGEVETSPDYADYIKWYEMVITNDENLEVINATEGGAKIEGAIQMPLSDVVDTYCTDSFDYESLIRDMPPTFGEEDAEKVLDKWKQSVDNLGLIKRKMSEGIMTIDKTVKMIKKGSYKRSDIDKAHKLIGEITSKCEEMEEIFFVDRMTAEETEDILADIYEAEPSSDAEHCRILEKLSDYLKIMRDAVDEVADMFKKIIEESNI